MKTSRRKFISTAVAGGLTNSSLPLSFRNSEAKLNDSDKDIKSRYARLDEIIGQPVLKRGLFTSPVIIETLELLRYGSNFLCRVRSRDGAEGISVGHSGPSALPNAGAHHEFKGLDTNVIFECPTSSLKVVDGKIKVPTGSGMGVNFDPDFVKKHEVVKM